MWLISKFMTYQPGKQTNAIHIFPNIYRSKGNQTTKFGQLVEYDMRNIFLEKAYTKCGGNIFPDSFLRILNWAYFWTNSLKFLRVCFYVRQVEGHQKNILKLSCRALAFTSYKEFQKTKRSGTSLPALFSARFLKKNIYLVIFYWLTIIHYLFVFTLWYIGHINIVIICTWLKSQDRNLCILRTERV